MRAYAYVNHGRWVADCPSQCGGAELAVADHFTCHSCGNAADLVWPEGEDAITAALALRPSVNRNWYPGETVGMLLAENADHGIFDPLNGGVTA